MQPLTRPPRHFVPETLVVDDWSQLEPLYQSLIDRSLETVSAIEQWLTDRTELESVLEEEAAWRYIRMQADTASEEKRARYTAWVEQLAPRLAPFEDRLNRHLAASPAFDQLDRERYHTYTRDLKSSIALYREENIPLFTELSVKEQQYGAIAGARTITLGTETLTMQQAGNRLQSTDRALREQVFHLMETRRSQDVEALDALYDELIALRQRVAANAGFSNFRDYSFEDKGRFDYTPEDCLTFHTAIEQEVVPVLRAFEKERVRVLGYDTYRPWDTSVDEYQRAPLKPFTDGNEMITQAIHAFHAVRPSYGDVLELMQTMGHLDVDSRPGKAPGGFNYPLYESGVPFIYMNAVGTQRDLETIMHEGGHALHAYWTRGLALNAWKNTPAEVAELASMSMELLSMPAWGHFYHDPADLKRAKIEQLKGTLEALPWIAAIDAFQHWIYTTPHTQEERTAYWLELMNRFGTGMVDWAGHEQTRATSWQQQLHLFEVPFYYIEYAMSQLGAMAMWKQFRETGAEALDHYEAALALGYTKTIPEIYETAGIRFAFTPDYVRSLVQFVCQELEQLSAT